MQLRQQIIAAARTWCGTPYHHQASTRGIGCDCLGLIRGVYRDVFGPEPERVPAYSMDWAIAEDSLRDAACRHLEEIDIADRAPGDVVLFKICGPAARHAAIITQSDPYTMIHAYSGYAVREEALQRWQKYLAYAFRFPGVQ